MTNILIKKLKELSLKANADLTEMEMRELIFYFLSFNGKEVQQVGTAKINDWDLFYKHLEVCKNYFKPFITDEQ